MRIQGTDWEKIRANQIPDKGFVSRIYDEHVQLNKKIKGSPIFKMDKRFE